MNTRTLAAAALALGLAACAQESSGVGIYAICAPPEPDTTTGACLYPTSCETVLVSNARLDTSTARLDFRLPLQLTNQLATNASSADGRVNTNDAFVQSLEMTYSGPGSVAGWTVPVSASVLATGSSVIQAPLIPVASFPGMAPSGPAAVATWVINVRAHGVFSGGDSFTTAWFQVPVEVCAGCLAGAVCPAGKVLYSCPSTAPGQTSPGQTASVTCITP